VHPHAHTIFSRNDIKQFLGGEDKFSIMANCEGSVTRAVVALDGKQTGTIRNKPLGYAGLMMDFAPDLTGDARRQYEHELELNEDNSLAGEAKKCKFCFYKREAKSGPLKLVAFDEKMPAAKRPGR
jgi:hypothetical protein